MAVYMTCYCHIRYEPNNTLASSPNKVVHGTVEVEKLRKGP